MSGTQDLGKDLSMSQIVGEGGSKDPPQDLDNTQKSEVIKSDETAQTNSKKRSEVCRFYTNGKCKFNNECRFMHPKICPKFRQHGDCKTKGCNGDCEFLHPNVCRNSLKDRTCSYNDCRFFHLKGTKTVEREYKKTNNTNAASNPNWRNKSQSKTNNQSRSNNQTRSSPVSKNRIAGLNLGSSNRKKKKNQNQAQAQNQNQTLNKQPAGEQVTQQEKIQLGQTLDAIMKRLTAMETRQAVYPQPGMQLHPQIQPLLSPAVPPPGTQTQFQWGSPCPWTQTQQTQH